MGGRVPVAGLCACPSLSCLHRAWQLWGHGQFPQCTHTHTCAHMHARMYPLSPSLVNVAMPHEMLVGQLGRAEDPPASAPNHQVSLSTFASRHLKPAACPGCAHACGPGDVGASQPADRRPSIPTAPGRHLSLHTRAPPVGHQGLSSAASRVIGISKSRPGAQGQPWVLTASSIPLLHRLLQGGGLLSGPHLCRPAVLQELEVHRALGACLW